MGIEQIDKNFATKRVKVENFDWFDYSHPNARLHGVFYDYENGEFLALAEVKDFENGTAIKSVKFFKI